jgi:hypothetical protein
LRCPALSALGALLAAIGLRTAGVQSPRTSEMGAHGFGATRGQVMVMVLKSALGLVLAGLVWHSPRHDDLRFSRGSWRN